MKSKICILLFTILNLSAFAQKQNAWIDAYNPIWTSQSANSSESMPCGGGDIGMNVWVENNEIFLYLSRSGTFDENNVFPKLGRVRLSLSPNPFEGAIFKQELRLRDGYIAIEAEKDGKKTEIDIWANVNIPVVEVAVKSAQPTSFTATYETWRTEPLVWEEAGRTRASIAYRDAPMKAVIQPDTVKHEGNKVLFYHRNQDNTLFDITVEQQQLSAIKHKLWNPMSRLTFGGEMQGQNMVVDGVVSGTYIDTDFKGYRLSSAKPVRNHHLSIAFHTEQTETLEDWENGLKATTANFAKTQKTQKANSRKWWNQFWDRSFVIINPDKAKENAPEWQVGRNYNLFRYQLGCNAYGTAPTKFNGGLFTFDPSLILKDFPYTPDHRDWGGGTHTAQNQRLVYWPMIKSGDFDMLPSQLNFYLRGLVNARERVQHYWGHPGACFTEQIEWFCLPMASSYGWKRSPKLDPGIQHNMWIDYEWDTVLEFCKMALYMHEYAGVDISAYLPLIEECLIFFDEHYQYLAEMQSARKLDAKGKLVLYPSTGCETYKMAYNSANTIAALKSVTSSLLNLPEGYLSAEKRKYWEGFMKRIPDLPLRERSGHTTLAPAETWQIINNIEIPQLYSVFPWGLYGIGLPDLEMAVDTWKYGIDNADQHGYISWHQDAIFCARLGLTEEAKEITLKKLTDSQRRYPTFWGPGHDWVPDHNWGGSGMIGVQEMLMQCPGDSIYLLPAWPKGWDVHFKLHAPCNTTVECEYKNGEVTNLIVLPQSRAKDVVLP